MTKRFRSLALILFFGVASASFAQTAPAPLATAVLEVEVTNESQREKATQFGALFMANLSVQEGIFLVERVQLETALGEQALGASGLTEAGSAARIGQLTGAKVLVTSKMIKAGNEFTIISKVIGTETGRVFAATKTFDRNVSTAASELAVQVGALERQHGAVLVAPVEDASARENRLRAFVAGKTLRPVTISIPERHITHPIPDPAAETEIARTLGAVGFSLVDASSADKADIAITGEAISEAAFRWGAFFSCKARVEIKVVEKATGRILLQDRQTEVAADIAESVAAKTALERAGLKLVDRIIPALVNDKK